MQSRQVSSPRIGLQRVLLFFILMCLADCYKQASCLTIIHNFNIFSFFNPNKWFSNSGVIESSGVRAAKSGSPFCGIQNADRVLSPSLEPVTHKPLKERMRNRHSKRVLQVTLTQPLN